MKNKQNETMSLMSMVRISAQIEKAVTSSKGCSRQEKYSGRLEVRNTHVYEVFIIFLHLNILKSRFSCQQRYFCYFSVSNLCQDGCFGDIALNNIYNMRQVPEIHDRSL